MKMPRLPVEVLARRLRRSTKLLRDFRIVVKHYRPFVSVPGANHITWAGNFVISDLVCMRQEQCNDAWFWPIC